MSKLSQNQSLQQNQETQLNAVENLRLREALDKEKKYAESNRLMLLSEVILGAGEKQVQFGAGENLAEQLQMELNLPKNNAMVTEFCERMIAELLSDLTPQPISLENYQIVISQTGTWELLSPSGKLMHRIAPEGLQKANDIIRWLKGRFVEALTSQTKEISESEFFTYGTDLLADDAMGQYGFEIIDGQYCIVDNEDGEIVDSSSSFDDFQQKYGGGRSSLTSAQLHKVKTYRLAHWLV